ncbi:MAG: hypothetical protein LBE34_06190 [Flavobacteriaceae bacterium]|jgi:uncharacterized membrane protein|nr:hypothetical protein [Flavobacteriaceae bacterium]
MWFRVRISLFILYSLINVSIACGVYISFHSQNESEHTLMNFFAYFIAPVFFAISTVVAFVLLWIINRIEQKPNTHQFSTLIKLVGITLFIDVILYSFSFLW